MGRRTRTKPKACSHKFSSVEKQKLKCLFKKGLVCKDSKPAGKSQGVHTRNMGCDAKGSMEIVGEADPRVDRAGNTGRAEGRYHDRCTKDDDEERIFGLNGDEA